MDSKATDEQSGELFASKKFKFIMRLIEKSASVGNLYIQQNSLLCLNHGAMLGLSKLKFASPFPQNVSGLNS